MSPTPTPTTPATPTSPKSPTKLALASKASLTSTSSIPLSSQQTNPIKQLTKELSDKMNINSDELIKEDFDVKSFTSAVIKTNILSEHLSNLSQSINKLDKEIREEVSLNHEDLLHQAINIETLEDMLEMIQSRIASLKSTSERLRSKISIPFNELQLRIRQLSRLQAACDTLRRIKGILSQSTKLRLHMQAGVKDIVKSAQCLNELDFLLRNFDYAGIEIIEPDVHFAFKSRREVDEQAQAILDKSLVHLDQSQIGTALQVFYSLGTLNQKLAETLKNNERNFQKLSLDLLNTTNLTLQSTSSSSNLHTSASSSSLHSQQQSLFPGRTNMPNVGSMGQFRAQLWTNIEKLMDSLYDACAQIVQLQQILEKKKDLVTNLLYIDDIDFAKIYSGKMYLITSASKSVDEAAQSSTTLAVNAYESICTVLDMNEINSKRSIEFLYEQWRRLTSHLGAQLASASTQSNYIKQTFQNEYPKLLKLQNDLWLRLIQLIPILDRYRYVPSSQSQQSQSEKSPKTNANRDTEKLNTNNNFQSAYELMRKCFADFENSYLNRSLSNLFDPINLIFSSAQSLDKQINRADIETYLKGVQSQLQTLQFDVFSSPLVASAALASIKASNQNNNHNLTFTNGYSSVFSDKVVQNMCKSIQMYANKAEQLVNGLNSELQSAIQSSSTTMSSTTKAGSNSANIFLHPGLTTTSLPYQIQMKNLDYVNVTNDLHEQLTRLFQNEAGKLLNNKKLEDKLSAALKSMLTFEENALKPFILSASDCILVIMLTMHQEEFNSSTGSSLYIRELQQVLQRVCRDYLQLYNCKPILSVYMSQLATRCIELFIRNASILRPMSDVTRTRLIKDSNEIEAIIQSQLNVKLTDLGVSYKQLKAFRHLLETKSPYDSTSVQNSSLGGEVCDEQHYEGVLSQLLPCNILLHYLFSYAPHEMKSPHQNLDWTVTRYSDWLDKHGNEKERLLVVKACLESYVNLVKQRKETKFASIYPLMIRLLEKGLQACANL